MDSGSTIKVRLTETSKTMAISGLSLPGADRPDRRPSRGQRVKLGFSVMPEVFEPLEVEHLRLAVACNCVRLSPRW